MVRFFEKLDDLFSQIVPLAYLLGLAAGTVTYFGGAIPNPVVAVGVCVGIAAELHFWLQQRRVRAAYGVLARMNQKDPRREVLLKQFRVQVAILVALGLFSMWNSNLFLASYWHPATSIVPDWLQSFIRGSVIPVLLWLTSSLMPLTEDPSAYLTRNANQILRKMLKETLRQMKGRIKKARKRGADLVPVSVALMVDIGDSDGARRLRMISEGIAEAEGETTGPTYTAPFFTDQPTWTPPNGPGGLPMPPDNEYAPPQPLYPRPRPKARTAEEARSDAETVIRNLLAQNPEMPRTEIMRRGHIAMGDVDYWRPIILREMGIQSKSRRGKPQRQHRRAS